jgi:hypothetical protein
MAIYNRWGDPLEIVVNYGQVYVKEDGVNATLVKVRYGTGAEDRFKFAETLKADNGWAEIEDAVTRLPVSTISASAKFKAIKQAL